MTLNAGIIRDDRYLEHKSGLDHPESPKRLSVAYRMMDYEFPSVFAELSPRLASLQELEAVHTPAYVATLLSTARRRFTHLAPDTSASAASCMAAWLAAGGCLTALEHLHGGDLQAAMVLCRPPGHHARRAQAGGFCIFNNLGVAARAALGMGYQRILIVDWDIHHGNALQNLFYDDPRVFYLSSHYLHHYPHTGVPEDVGQGAGRGYNLNLNVPEDLNNSDVLHLYREVVPPIARGFRPQLIMVAAGFDAHMNDPIGITRLTEDAYAGLTELLISLGPEAEGAPLLLALEGGYDPPSLSACLRRVMQAMQGTAGETRIWSAHSQRAEEMVADTRRIHLPFGVWRD